MNTITINTVYRGDEDFSDCLQCDRGDETQGLIDVLKSEVTTSDLLGPPEVVFSNFFSENGAFVRCPLCDVGR